jgi:hypothetical protein
MTSNSNSAPMVALMTAEMKVADDPEPGALLTNSRWL